MFAIQKRKTGGVPLEKRQCALSRMEVAASQVGIIGAQRFEVPSYGFGVALQKRAGPAAAS